MDGLPEFTAPLQSVINLKVELKRYMYNRALTVLEFKTRSSFCVNSEKVPKARA